MYPALHKCMHDKIESFKSFLYELTHSLCPWSSQPGWTQTMQDSHDEGLDVNELCGAAMMHQALIATHWHYWR